MSNVVIQGNASGTGDFTIAAPNSNTDRTLTLPDETGTVLTTSGVPSSAMPAGSVLQVVQGTFNTQTSMTGTTAVATGLTATITPTSSSNKILITVYIPAYNTNSAANAYFSIYKNGTSLQQVAYYQTGTTGLVLPYNATYYDSSATTSATTYAIYATTAAGATHFWSFGNLQSNITLMEIAA